MLVVGIVLIVIAAGLIVWHVFARRKAGELKTAKPSKVADLLDLARRMAEEIGDGGLTEFAELTGTASREEPLISPLAERPCLYYEMTVTRRYEEEFSYQDKDGRTRRGTRQGSEVMSRESDYGDFWLTDKTDSIAVRLAEAEYDGLRETVDRFEPGESYGASLRVGRFSLNLRGLGGGRRTLGYQYKERILPIDTQLTVIGQVSDAGGELAVGAGGLRYIVSTRTRKQIIGSAERVAKFTSIASGVLMLLGVALIIGGLF